MAYENFKPLVWSTKIQTETPELTVFEKTCDYQFEGEIEKGKDLKILGVARPTIGDYNGGDIGDPERVPDSDQLLRIDKAKFFHFGVGDIDKAQAQDGLMDKLIKGASVGLANERDKYIANLMTGATYSGTAKAITTTADCEAELTAALEKLAENGVRIGYDKVTAFLDPKRWFLMAKYIIDLRTSNDKALATGRVGDYLGCKLVMCPHIAIKNNVKYIPVKTEKAVAFASCINEVTAYRPERKFEDAVKGLNTFGGKIVRQKELYVIKANA